MNRARFVMLGTVVVAIILFAPDLYRQAMGTVPTAHQPALLLSFDRRETGALAEQIAAIEGVRAVEFETVDRGANADPIIFGTVRYEGFTLNWRPEEHFADFHTVLRPSKRRFAGEPDPAQIDAAMRELEALLAGLEPGSALFISDEELRLPR